MDATLIRYAWLVPVAVFWACVYPRGNVEAYRMATGAMYLFAVLGVLPFADFYAVSSGLRTWVHESAIISVLMPCMALSATPLLKRVRSGYAAMMLAVALPFTMLVRSDEIENHLKTALADAANVFAGPVPIGPLRKASLTTVEFVHSDGGYSLRIPQRWQRYQLPTWGFAYFRRVDGPSVQVELRPDCFHQAEEPLAVLQYRKRLEPNTEEIRCYRWRQSFRACLIKERAGAAGRTVDARYWLAQDGASGQYIAISFLVYADGSEIEQEISEIVASVELKKFSSPKPFCPGVAEWAILPAQPSS